MLISRQMTKLRKIFMILLLAAAVPAAAQRVHYTISPKNAEGVLKVENIRSTVDYLCDQKLGGRATGSGGAAKAAGWLENQFRGLQLQPLGGAWLHGFKTSSGFARNVIGLIPGTANPARYVLVTAHYDNLGNLGGTFYPGADSNASGVAAMLEVARMFKQMKDCKKTYPCGIIFVALDGKEKNSAGAAELWREIESGKLINHATGEAISASQIILEVNLDQLGATLAPITKGNPNYIIMLSEEATGRRNTLLNANKDQHLGLEIGFDYYGSKDFTNLFYNRVGDQCIFMEHGIPAVVFTSGITMNNNKVTDTPSTLDYNVMRKRIQLIFYWLDKVL